MARIKDYRKCSRLDEGAGAVDDHSGLCRVAALETIAALLEFARGLHAHVSDNGDARPRELGNVLCGVAVAFAFDGVGAALTDYAGGVSLRLLGGTVLADVMNLCALQ